MRDKLEATSEIPKFDRTTGADGKSRPARRPCLGQQRRFVLWWDGQVKHPGNRAAGRGNVRPSQNTDGLRAEDLGLDRDTIHRWRKRLKDEDDYEAERAKAHARGVKITEFERGASGVDNHLSQGSGENEWYSTNEKVCERLLEDTGVAILPGSAFGRPSEEFSVRLAYVNFGGEQALAAAAEIPDPLPLSQDFLKVHCGRVVEAIERMCAWIHSA